MNSKPSSSAPQPTCALDAQGSQDRDHRALEFESLAISDPYAATQSFPLIRTEFEQAHDLAAAARVARAVINAFSHLGDTAEALRVAARARKLALRDRATRAAAIEAARVLVAAMHPRVKRGNMRGALRAGSRAVIELRALGEHTLVARAELNLANVAKALGRPADAAALLERVLAQGSTIDPIRGAALNALGESCVQLAQFARAIGAFDEAARFYEVQGGHLHAALASGNLAHTLAKSGDIEAALHAFRLAREQFQALGAHAEVCRLAFEEAELLEDAGLLHDAADLASHAAELAARYSLRADEARASLLRGRLELSCGNACEALNHLDHAHAIATILGDQIGISQSQVARTTCLVRCGKRAEAQAAANAALAIAETPLERVFALLANSFAQRNAGIDAVGTAREACDLAESLNVSAIVAEAELAFARALRQSAEVMERSEVRYDIRRQALASARKAVRGVEHVQDRIAVNTIRRSFLSHRLEAYNELASQLLLPLEVCSADVEGIDAAHVAEALDVLENARNRTIVESLTRTKPLQHESRCFAHSPVLDPSEQRAEVLAAASHSVRIEARSALDRAIHQAVQHVREHTAERVDEEIAARVPGASRASGAHIAPIASTESAHATSERPHSRAIVFFEDQGKLGAFCVPCSSDRATSTNFVWLTHDLSALLEKIARFRFQVARYLSGATMSSPRANAAGLAAGHAAFEALRVALFEPLHDYLRTSSDLSATNSIVLVPSPSLAGLPLGLLAPVDTFASVAPSLGIAARLDANSRVARTTGQALVVSVADERTAGFAREGRRVAERVTSDGGKVVHLDGAAATRASFVHALGSCDSAHIACHGLFPANAPNLAGLLLADGWFGAHEAHALASVPEEIILSGCSTGLASDGAGEQWFGLLRGFAAAGASRMIASLWPVRDEDGERLMEAVYTHDDAGASSPGVGSTRTARLVAASRLMLKSGAHPAAAAAFAVVGGATAFHRRSSADPGFHRDGRSASFAD